MGLWFFILDISNQDSWKHETILQYNWYGWLGEKLVNIILLQLMGRLQQVHHVWMSFKLIFKTYENNKIYTCADNGL